MFDIRGRINDWLAHNQQIVLATVVKTWGSAPRQAGAKMAITESLDMIGSLSGGCIEPAIAQEAIDILTTRQPGLFHFGISDDLAWDVGLACGGEIDIYAEVLDRAWWEALDLNKPMATVTNLTNGRKVLVDKDGVRFRSPEVSDQQASSLAELASLHLTQRKSEVTEVDGEPVFVDIHLPRPRLIIVGGAHVAMVLQKMATVVGFAVTLIDPRRAFASQERFPEVSEILHEYPQHAFKKLVLDRDTFVVVLTHDPKIDDPALIAALTSQAAYIGVMSSRQTHHRRLERLSQKGISQTDLARIHAPIGLNIHARSPEEIALAIMAEIVSTKNAPADPERSDEV